MRRCFLYKRSLGLSFPYDPRLVQGARSIGDGTWVPDEKIWKFPKKRVRSVVQFAQENSFDIAPEVLTLAEQAPPEYRVNIVEGGVEYRVTDETDAPHITHTIPPRSPIGLHRVPISALGEVLRWADASGLSVHPEARNIHAQRTKNAIKNYSLSTATQAPPLPITGLTSTPLPPQWVPANHALTNPRFLLADEQGLGKTLESLMIARITGHEAHKVIVVCPSSLTHNWVKEAEAHFAPHTFTPFVAEGQTPTDIPPKTDLLVIGWAILPFWVKTLTQWGYDMVIADEGHYGKSGKEKFAHTGKKKVKVSGSQRSGAFIDLFGALPLHGKAIVLTGTPTPNNPIELYPILQALGHGNMFGGEMPFKVRYANGKLKRIGNKPNGAPLYVWTFSGGSHLIELNTALRSSGLYIRRTKEHLVNGGQLPKKYVDGAEFFSSGTPSPLYIDGEAEAMKEYRSIAQNPYWRSPQAWKNGGALTLLAKLRPVAGKAAIPTVITKVKELIGQGEKVLVVAHHKEIVDTYMETFPGAVKIQGGMSTKAVEKAKEKFNSAGMEHPVLVMSIDAGKTGHTLCLQPDKTCAYVIFAEQVWVPGDEHQAQDRIWRIGQNREVHVINIVVKDTVSEMMYKARAQKNKTINELVDSIVEEKESDLLARYMR